MTTNLHQGSFWSDGNVLKLNCNEAGTSAHLLEIIEKMTFSMKK